MNPRSTLRALRFRRKKKWSEFSTRNCGTTQISDSYALAPSITLNPGLEPDRLQQENASSSGMGLDGKFAQQRWRAGHIRFGSDSDMSMYLDHFRFAPMNGHHQARTPSRKSARRRPAQVGRASPSLHRRRRIFPTSTPEGVRRGFRAATWVVTNKTNGFGLSFGSTDAEYACGFDRARR